MALQTQANKAVPHENQNKILLLTCAPKLLWLIFVMQNLVFKHKPLDNKCLKLAAFVEAKEDEMEHRDPNLYKKNSSIEFDSTLALTDSKGSLIGQILRRVKFYAKISLWDWLLVAGSSWRICF